MQSYPRSSKVVAGRPGRPRSSQIAEIQKQITFVLAPEGFVEEGSFEVGLGLWLIWGVFFLGECFGRLEHLRALPWLERCPPGLTSCYLSLSQLAEAAL